jgi:hypothetical protein
VINVVVSLLVSQIPTIKMTGAAMPICDRAVPVAMQVVATKMPVSVPAHQTAAVTSPPLRLVEWKIDVVTFNHRVTDGQDSRRNNLVQI